MRPLMIFGVSAVAFSFFTSNNLIPVANLKFGSRMYDIQKQKPALRLDAGVFNDDFEGYAIHIKEKSDDKYIKDVLIYDHSEASKGRLSQIMAEQGEMYATEDGSYFFMKLDNGHQYMETEPNVSSGGRSYPFVRTNFASWTKIFDLSEFDLNRTNEELFKSNRSMMTSPQLKVAADSISIKIQRREVGLSNQISNYFHYLEKDSTFLVIEELQEITKLDTSAVVDSLSNISNIDIDSTSSTKDTLLSKTDIGQQDKIREAKKKTNKFGGKPIDQRIELNLEDYDSFIELFRKDRDKERLLGKAKSTMRSIHAHSESAVRTLDRMQESRVKHIYELHTKYSMAVICFIFLFIGAPMGAIVRKGGFGYPILISILFFMIFIVLTIFCRKIAETFVLPAAMAAWVPCSVLFPVGLLLTYQAMNDNKLINPDRYFLFISKVVKFFKRKK